MAEMRFGNRHSDQSHHHHPDGVVRVRSRSVTVDLRSGGSVEVTRASSGGEEARSGQLSGWIVSISRRS